MKAHEKWDKCKMGLRERLCWAPWRAFPDQKSKPVRCPSLGGFLWKIEYTVLYREFVMAMGNMRIKASVVLLAKKWSKGQGWKVTWDAGYGKWLWSCLS